MQAVHFITFYVPLWGAILYNGFTYFQVIRMLNNATRVCLLLSLSNYFHNFNPMHLCNSKQGHMSTIFGNFRWQSACQIVHTSLIQGQTRR